MAVQENRYKRSDKYYFRTKPEICHILRKMSEIENLPVNVVLENIIIKYYGDWKKHFTKGSMRW